MANFIGKSITIKWDGADHKINVTNDLCNHLESSGVNLFQMSVNLTSGEPPKFFLIGNLITMLLNSVGVKVNQAQVMQKLTQEPADSIALYQFCQAFMGLVFPLPDEKSMGKSEPETAKG